MKYDFFAGSYGNENEEGIVKFRLDTEKETLTRMDGYRGIRNPSYVLVNAEKNLLYAVRETVREARIHTMRLDGSSSRWSSLSGGADPCYISLSDGKRYLMAANYTSGSLSVYRLDRDGIPAEMTDFLEYEGIGKNPVRQERPHIHFIRETDGNVFVVDLGLDRVLLYRLNVETGRLEETGKYLSFPSGSGPRHLAFAGDMIYAVCELTGQLAAFKKENGRYRLKALLSTLPEGYLGDNLAAAIRVKDNLVFVSNRGHDSIAVYWLDKDGIPRLKEIVPTGGKTPRDFEIFGDYLVAANQDSDTITVLRLTGEDKKLVPSGIAARMIRPTCIAAVRENGRR